MLSEKQIQEIQEHLEKAQNPLFFFDNDNDGLMSFLLLRRYIGRGKGVAIRSFPELNASYYHKVKELNPDYIFILDKPVVSREFLKKANEDHLPVVWIDHHKVDSAISGSDFESINYYNLFLNDELYEPVSYLCYKLSNRREDIWLAVIGCVSDALIPDFYEEFLEKYPELGKKDPKSAFDIFYNSEIGKISQVLDFSLKDSTTNVVNMLRFMVDVKGPMDVLEENSRTKHFLNRFNEINLKFEELMNRARESVNGGLIFFQYGGSLSLSAHIANKLSYEFSDKVIVVVFVNGDVANVSLRGGNDVRSLTLKAIEGIDGASGGGHKQATGAKMLVGDLEKFKENIEKLVEETQ